MKKSIYSHTLLYLFIFATFSAILHAQEIELHNGWNLKGATEIIDVYNVFNSPSIIESVWKWDNNNWKLYLPDDENGSYAESKGFGKLNSINTGEGYWVNSNSNIKLSNQKYNATFDFKKYIMQKGMKIYKTVDQVSIEYIFVTCTPKIQNSTEIFIQNYTMKNLNGTETYDTILNYKLYEDGSFYETSSEDYLYDYPVLYGTSNMKFGDTITNIYKRIYTETNQSTINFSKYTFHGFCEVQTLAGTFQNCLEVLETREIIDGVNIRYLHYWAPNLGVIKRKIYFDDADNKEDFDDADIINELIYADVNGTEYGRYPPFL